MAEVLLAGGSDPNAKTDVTTPCTQHLTRVNGLLMDRKEIPLSILLQTTHIVNWLRYCWQTMLTQISETRCAPHVCPFTAAAILECF